MHIQLQRPEDKTANMEFLPMDYLVGMIGRTKDLLMAARTSNDCDRSKSTSDKYQAGHSLAEVCAEILECRHYRGKRVG